MSQPKQFSRIEDRFQFWAENHATSWREILGFQACWRNYCVMEHHTSDGRTLWSIICHRVDDCFELDEVHEAITDENFAYETIFSDVESCRVAVALLMNRVWPAK